MNRPLCFLFAIVIMFLVCRGNQQVINEQIQEREEFEVSLQSIAGMLFNENVEIGIQRMAMLLAPNFIATVGIREASSLYRSSTQLLEFNGHIHDINTGSQSFDLSPLFGLMAVSAVSNYIVGASFIDRESIRSNMAFALSAWQFATILYFFIFSSNEASLIETAIISGISSRSLFGFNFFITMLVLYPYIMRKLNSDEE